MKFGLTFFAGICMGMLLALGLIYLGQVHQYQDIATSISRFSVQDLAELRVLHERLGKILESTGQSNYALRRPIVHSLRVAKTNMVVALPEPASRLLPSAAISSPHPASAVIARALQEDTSTPKVTAHVQEDTPPAKALKVKDKLITASRPKTDAPVKTPKNTPVSTPTVSSNKNKTQVSSLTPDQLYAQALKAYQEHRYVQSREQFTHFVQTYPKHKLVPNALYWTGETWYAQGKYSEAHLSFDQVVQRFPRHAKSADALLKMAYSQIRLGNPQQARIYLDQLDTSYPKTEASRLGQQARSKLQGDLGRATRVV